MGPCFPISRIVTVVNKITFWSQLYKLVHVLFRFMIRHILDLYEHVLAGPPEDRQREWNVILQRIYNQVHLRMVSCCQVASKLISHYKVLQLRHLIYRGQLY